MGNAIIVDVTAGSAPSVAAPEVTALGSTMTIDAPVVTPGSAPVVDARIPQYVADGYSGSGTTRTLTFSGGAPPTDGSMGLCTVIINISTGLSYTGGAYQRLLYWADTTVGLARVSGNSGIDFVGVPAWSFVADANVST